MRRKASICLGSLSLILSAKEATSLGENLVNSMISNEKNKELLYYTIGFSSFLKGAANKLGPNVVKVLPFILKDIEMRIEAQDEDFEYVNELLDYYLSILDNLIKKCPTEVKPQLKKIIDVLSPLLSYDPNSTLNDGAGADPQDSKQLSSIIK